MRRVIYLLLFAAVGLMTACSDDGANSPDKELAMVMLKSEGNARVLLLEDGTLANPVSGIDNFDLLRLGKKLLLSYKVVSTEDGVANIRVTEFEAADDSTFIVEPADAEPIFSSSFTGSFYIANADSTEIHYGDASFSFGSEAGAETSVDYSMEPSGEESFTGETTFTLDNGRIIFFDESDNILVPQKGYDYSVWEDMLYIWTVRDDGTFISYALHRVD
jgi:hypothetical protein